MGDRGLKECVKKIVETDREKDRRERGQTDREMGERQTERWERDGRETDTQDKDR
jgi:hypothetical protein